MSNPAKPKLRVEFAIDEATQSPKLDENGNYVIQFFVDDAPPELGSVVYELDPTYYDPLREKRRSPNNPKFTEITSTYGDYDLTATLRLPGKLQTLTTPISGALRATYQGQMSAGIEAAIHDIASH